MLCLPETGPGSWLEENACFIAKFVHKLVTLPRSSHHGLVWHAPSIPDLGSSGIWLERISLITLDTTTCPRCEILGAGDQLISLLASFFLEPLIQNIYLSIIYLSIFSSVYLPIINLSHTPSSIQFFF